MDTDQYDVVFNDAASPVVTIGAMLVRDGKNAVMEQSVDAEVLPPRVLTAGEFTNAQFPPTIRVTMKQDDWRYGLGGQLYSKSPYGYNTSTGMDCSTDKVIKLPAEAQATTYDTAPSNPQGGPGGFATSGSGYLWHFADSGTGASVSCYLWDFITDRRFELQGAALATTNGNYFGNGVEYNGNVYVPCEGAATADGDPGYHIFQAVGAAAWTLTTLTPFRFKYFAVADGRLWGGYVGTNKHHVYSSLDATNASGSWAGPTAIGNSSSAITALVPWGQNNDILLICKEDGIYTLDVPGNVIKLYDATSVFHPNNFRNAVNWNGRVILPLGARGMLELLPDGTVRDISVSIFAPDVTKLHGKVISTAATPDALYLLLQDPTVSTTGYVVKGEIRDDEYRWHILQTLTISSSAAYLYRNKFLAFGDTSGSDVYRRLWLARDGSTGNRPLFLPLSSQDRDFAYEDSPSLTLDTVDWDANLPQVTKLLVDVMFTTKNLSSGAGGHTIPVQYSVDSGTTWANLGTANILNTSPTQTLTFPAGTTGTKVRLRPNPLRGTTAATGPEIHDFTISAAYRPAVKKIVTYRMNMKNGLPNLTGFPITNMPSVISQLRTWNNTATGITVKDRFSQAGRTMITLPGSMKEFAGSRRYNGRDDYIVEMSFLEV